jgi:DNA (cytosine-5)-methyltransferase 1
MAPPELGRTGMTRPRLLDLFCGAGGAAAGYVRAGFDVVGVDIRPQPHYLLSGASEFHQADALTYPLEGFDAIHASPPCQPNVKGLRAVNVALGREFHHEDRVAEVRDRVRRSGASYVLENAEGALRDAVRLCGTSFGLPLRRHRDIESNVALLVPPCAHGWFRVQRYWTSDQSRGKGRRASTVQVYGNGGETHEWGPAMGIDWMTPAEMREAIPPAYTEWIGAQLLRVIEAERVA